MKKYQKHSYLFLSSALIMSSIAPSMAHAEDTTNDTTQANVGLKEGEFTLKTSETVGFGQHQIENKKKTVTSGFAGDFGVIDARGTQEGWNVTVSATPFTIIEPTTGWVKENPYQLPSGSLSLASLSSVTGVNNEKEEVRPTIQTVDKGIDLNEAVKIATAGVGKGMGEHTLTYGAEALSLVIDPLTAKIDTVNYPDSVTPYESTITWNLISGPTNEVSNENGNNNIPLEETDVSYFSYMINNDTVTITNFSAPSDVKDVVIPSYIEGKPVTSIGQIAFVYKGIESVVLPETLISIQSNAFQSNKITSIVIPNSVKSIDGHAFHSNKLEGDLKLPNGLETIGASAFANNNLTSVSIPESIKTIGTKAFYTNQNLKEVSNYSSLDVTDRFDSNPTIK